MNDECAPLVDQWVITIKRNIDYLRDQILKDDKIEAKDVFGTILSQIATGYQTMIACQDETSRYRLSRY